MFKGYVADKINAYIIEFEDDSLLKLHVHLKDKPKFLYTGTMQDLMKTCFKIEGRIDHTDYNPLEHLNTPYGGTTP
jgi:hypothetical protein